MNTLTLRNNPHSRFLGFDDLFRELQNPNLGFEDTYPPHNIVQQDENQYRIEMALAGFTESDLNIQVEDGVLTVSGKQEEAQTKDQEPNYLHRGIARRSFERSFRLGQDVEVLSASMENGILSIDLERQIPEEKKPKQIPINGKVEEVDSGSGVKSFLGKKSKTA